MKLIQSLIAVSVVLLAAQAHAAAPTFTSVKATAGTYYPITGYTTTSSPSQVFVVPYGTDGHGTSTPSYDTGGYLAITPGGSATYALNGAKSFSFLWGSPDGHNMISIDGTSWYGNQLLGSGDTVWATFSSSTGMQNITFSDASGDFELAFAANSFPAVAPPSPVAVAVAAVPEPGTYALLLAGLGVVGYTARRRR